MPKADLVADLARKLTETLRQHGRPDSPAWPLTLRHLAELADPPATPEQVQKALAKKPFAAEFVLAAKKSPDSPVALTDDADRLAASPALLEFALGRLCSAEKPLHPVHKVVGQVEKVLRPSFEAALQASLDNRTLPATAGAVTAKGKTQLHLNRFPPPPPPAVELAERLVRALRDERSRGEAYPPTLGRLVEKAGKDARLALLKKALAESAFVEHAVVLCPGLSDSPVSLGADVNDTLSVARTLELVVTATRTGDRQALSVVELAKKVAPELRDRFRSAAADRIAAGTLPPSVGCLRIKKVPHLFLLRDVVEPTGEASEGRKPPEGAPPGAYAPRSPTGDRGTPLDDFGRSFAAAFARLDEANGEANLVSLADLRRNMPVARDAFDEGLRMLRRAGRYTLASAEGRHAIGPEEQEAGIAENGSLLLYVSRKSP